MSERHETANALANAIKRHSPAPLSDADAAEAVRNLVGFFELLIQAKKETPKKR